MIIVRTPLRISIAGGGTDIPQRRSKHGCMFISAAIDKYIYITFHESLYAKSIRARYSKMEEVNSLEEIKNEILRETLRYYHKTSGMEITSHADIPTRTGLGSSGSFAVALVGAIAKAKKLNKSLGEIAAEAWDIEVNRLGWYGGKQDQYAAVMGGLNIMYFDRDSVLIKAFPRELTQKLHKYLLLVYTSGERKSRLIQRKF